MKQNYKTELWVGLFLFIGLILAIIMVVNLGKFSDKMKDTYTIEAVFKNAAGIINGSEVRLGGARIGKVSSTPKLTPNGDAVSLDITMNKDIHLQQGSEIKIATLNLLGDKYIEITPPKEPTTSYIDPGDVIYGTSGDDLDKIKENLADISTRTIDLMDKLQKTVGEFEVATKEFTVMAKHINEGVLNEQNTKNFSLVMSNVAEASGNLVKASEDIPGAIDDFKDTAENIKEASVDIRSLVGRVNDKITDLEPSIKLVEPTILALKESADGMQSTIKDLKKGDGILGALLYDKSMKVDIQDFIRHLRAQGLLRYKNPEAENELNQYIERKGMQGPRRY